jgi:hypothetical protein
MTGASTGASGQRAKQYLKVTVFWILWLIPWMLAVIAAAVLVAIAMRAPGNLPGAVPALVVQTLVLALAGWLGERICSDYRFAVPLWWLPSIVAVALRLAGNAILNHAADPRLVLTGLTMAVPLVVGQWLGHRQSLRRAALQGSVGGAEVVAPSIEQRHRADGVR